LENTLSVVKPELNPIHLWLPLVPESPSVKQVLIRGTPGQESVILRSVDVNATVGSGDGGRLNVAELVHVPLHQAHAITRHSYSHEYPYTAITKVKRNKTACP